MSVSITPSPYQKNIPLFVTGALTGNGSDTTEDPLQSFTVPANTLRNNGDQLRITVGGGVIASTDSKVVKVHWNTITGTQVYNTTLNTAAMSRWSCIINIVKTGTGTQSFSTVGSVGSSAASGALSGTAPQNETLALPIVVTGQNSTNPTPNSITCQFMYVEFIGAP